MNKRILKIIVTVWAFFISVDQVVLFFSSGNLAWSDPKPYAALILFIAAVLILIPGMEKLDRLLLFVISAFFVFFAAMGIMELVNAVINVIKLDDGIGGLFSKTSVLLKDIFFNLIPATLGFMYLTTKRK